MSDENDDGKDREGERATAWLLSAIVENIPNMIFVKDAAELRFTLFNRAGEELLGTSRSALLGKNDFDFFPPEDAEFFQRKDRETLAGKVLLDIPEEPLKTSNGTRYLHTRKVPILDDKGTPRYLLGISEDITERIAADSELRAAKVQAETAGAELEAFAYSVAHDLRAPLRGIDGFSQALLDEYADKLDENGQKYLNHVRQAAQRMAQLIDDLLMLSRVTRAELKAQRTDLSALARAAFDQLRQADVRAGRAQRDVDIVIEENLIVEGDTRLLAVLLDNLIANAWKFTSKRPRARIEVASMKVDGQRVFFVRDDGAGFDMTYIDKLFGPFQRLHGATEFDGTGIGLAAVQRVVRRHGGRVWAEGVVDKGATFFFEFGDSQ